MPKSLLLCFVIFASLGTFFITTYSALAAEQSPKEGDQSPPVAKGADRKAPAREDAKKKVEEAKKEDKGTPDKKPECVRGMKALSRPFSVPCPIGVSE
jgi:hypothetical protein